MENNRKRYFEYVSYTRGDKMRTKNIVRNYIYIAFIFGMLFLTLTPPFQAPDENNHFKKAYVISEGNIFPEIKNNKVGYMLPKEMVDYIEEQNQVAGKLDYKFNYKDIYFQERLPEGYTQQKFYEFPTATTTPVAHVIPAAGICFGKMMAYILDITNPSEVYLLYFARLFNLMFYILITGLSIYITPVIKRVFALVGLMPMSLFLARTVSYDVLMIACSFLAIAIICDIAFGKEKQTIKLSYLIALGGIAYVLASIKIVYLPIYILLLVFPVHKNMNLKTFVKKVSVIACIAIGVFLLFKIITPDFSQVIDARKADLSAEQMAFVVHHPIEYIKIFLSTLSERRQYYLSTTIGTFGLIDTNLHSVFLSLYMILLPIIGICEVSLDKIRVRVIDRIAVLVCVGSSIFGSFLALYLNWTSILDGYGVGASSITGVQGRYFIPVIPVIFLFFANCQTEHYPKVEKGMYLIVDNSTLLSIVMLIVSALVILLRFWC